MGQAHGGLWSCVSNSLAFMCQSWALEVASANLVCRSAILLSLASPSAWVAFSSSLGGGIGLPQGGQGTPAELPDVLGDVQPGLPQARRNTADIAGHIEVPQGLACATAGSFFNPPHPPKPLNPPELTATAAASQLEGLGAFRVGLGAGVALGSAGSS